MTTNFTMRRALGAGVAAFAALTLAACGGSDDDGGDAAETSAAAEADFNDTDVMFAQMMIPHHEQAVEMAALAQEQSFDPEVLAVADQVAATQGPELETMTGLLEAWGEPAEAEGHDMGDDGMADETQMAELEAAEGAEFDRMFVEMMIAHHQGAITMAEDAHTGGQNTEAVELAAQIHEEQTAELAELEAILAQL